MAKRAGAEQAFAKITGAGAKSTSTEASAKPEYIRRTYYITEEQYRAMRLRAALSQSPDEKDLSAIVRAALDAYLAKELEKL